MIDWTVGTVSTISCVCSNGVFLANHQQPKHIIELEKGHNKRPFFWVVFLTETEGEDLCSEGGI